MSSYKDQRKDTQRAERSVPICLKADLVADWEAADRELKRARDTNRSSDSKEGVGLGELVDRVRTLEAEMLEHTEQYRLRALPRHKFRALVAAHSPRTDENSEPIPEDAQVGVNRETFFPALIRACTVSPELDDADWTWLFGHTDSQRAALEADGKADEVEDGVLTDRQFGDLEDVAWFLNRGEVGVPFSHAASLAIRDSADE